MNRTVFAFLIIILFVSCTEKPSGATFLSFSESGPEGDVYPVRMLINERFLRIEDGDVRDGFIVFDRAKKIVYSVSHTDKTTLVLRSEPVKLDPPRAFAHQVERDGEKLSDVGGRAVTHYRLLTNRESCFDVYAAEGLLPEALAALREYHRALAAEQAAMQAQVPAGFQSACDLAEYVFLPARHLEFGFPVRQISRAGVMRQLLDFKTGVPVEKGLFDVPTDYKQITPAEVRNK
jgi:hypothetical protein